MRLLSTRHNRLIPASVTAIALASVAAAWLLGAERGPIEVGKDVQVQYLALRLEYVRATEGWLQSSASAMQALADVQAKDKVRGSPDTYLEAFKAYVESEGVSILFHVANLKAEQRGSAAADLIDFQAEMIGELTDLEITSRAADIEPQYR